MKKNKKIISIVIIIFIVFSSFISYLSKTNGSELNNNIELYKLSNNNYTPRTLNDYNDSLANANSILNNLFISKNDVDEAVKKLEESYNNLDVLPDKTKLREKHNHYLEFDLSSFTPKSVKKFNYILNNVKDVLNNENSTENDVQNSLNQINSIESVLVLKADKTELISLKNKLINLDKSKYVSSSISFLDDALNDIEIILNDEDVSNQNVQKLVLKYNDDFNNLVLKGNKNNFDKLVNQVKNINKSNYTSTSYNNLINTLNDVNMFVDNDDFSQKEIDEAYDKLKSSFNQLKKYTKGVYQINVSYTLISNNSVGSDWSKSTYYNGGTFYSGNKITSNLNSTIFLVTKIVEEDNYPDVGSSTSTIVLKDGYSTSSFITITEDRGRYTGNTATWKVVYTVRCLEKK